ncbi:metal binding domain of Ada-domain-containing protein [Aspergillus unguis]
MSQILNPLAIPRLLTPTRSTTEATTSASRWRAVSSRDPSATFIYGVKTTKIYCRPSCSSRLARRANVEFYDTPNQAERAGFRPCKRCKPESLKPIVNKQTLVVQRACRMIEKFVNQSNGASVRSKPTLAELAAEAGLTPCHFHRVFRKIMGVTPGAYAADAVRKAGDDFQDAEDRSVKDNRSSKDQNGDEEGANTLLQPCDEMLYADLEAWLSEGMHWDSDPGIQSDGFDANVHNAQSWNDFDVLIAAEAEYMACQGMHPLTGAP